VRAIYLGLAWLTFHLVSVFSLFSCVSLDVSDPIHPPLLLSIARRPSSGQDFALHPLDVTDMQVLTSPDGTHNFTVCTNAFTDLGTIAAGETDALFGDSFLRNVYTA
jgi:hypothetical protein